jgi:hypothetical protein
MYLNRLVLFLAFLILLGAGIGYWMDSRLQLRSRHIAVMIVIGVFLLVFGIPLMATICLVDGCSLGATVMTLTPVILGFELLIVGVSIPIIRKFIS